MKSRLKSLSNKKLTVKEMVTITGGRCPKTAEECHAAGGSAEQIAECMTHVL